MASLRQRGVAYHLYDPTTFPAASHLSFTINRDSRAAYLRQNDVVLCLNDITAVWDRSNAIIPPIAQVKKNLHSYIAAESQTFLEGLYYLLPEAFWIPDPISARTARLKFWQLQLAAELGFTIPDTYVGNDPAIAATLIENHEALALKVIHRKYLEYELTPLDKLKKFFYDFRYRGMLRQYADTPLILEELQYRRRATMLTRRFVQAEAGPFLKALPVAPVTIQEYIPKKLELRITVLGDRVFPCAIYSQEGASHVQVDWRHDTEALRHEPYVLPSEIEAKCLALMRRLGLQFGAIDLIVTPSEEYVFLENNVDGQWLWVQDKTGMPIAETLADLLITKQKQ
jgi:hypothetical protein